jgi:hypothetical protein
MCRKEYSGEYCQIDAGPLKQKCYFRVMNKLSNAESVQVVAALVEGNPLRSIVRMTGIHRTTIQKLLCDLEEACSAYQSDAFRNLPCKRIQCDEIWTFVGAKEKNASSEQKAQGWGDAWTWVSTCFVERQNLTMRIGMRPFTRLTNGFSKKLANHEHAIALHYMHYNFCRIHQTLCVTPAMEARVSDHVWSLAEVVALLN